MLAVEAIDVRKRLGTVCVLDSLTLRVEAGEVYGLLGPNGAGKSTLLHVILGLLRPDRGTLRVLGTAPERARARVGYLPERPRYHAHFAPLEYLRALGALSDLSGPELEARCRDLLALVGLSDAASRRLGQFSKGMLQRFGIAQALLHAPDLLLVDEPSSGLDPAGQREIVDLLLALRRQGHTIVMCTHHLGEAHQLCDRVGVLSRGRLAAEVVVASAGGIGGLEALYIAATRGDSTLLSDGPAAPLPQRR
jgi:ABC-2 type transport system ATP-binding protein